MDRGPPESGTEGGAWTAWLRRFDWDWFVTPSFRHPVTPRRALAAVEAWLAPLPGAYAAVGLQRGPLGDRLHVHAVIGGTGRRGLTETFLRGSWRRGDLHLDGYRPCKGGVLERMPAETARELLATWVDALYVDCRRKDRRSARLVLRRVPSASFSSGSQARPGRGRPCSPAGSPPSCPR